MKKFFAFLLTFAMLFSLAMPAMAAEITGESNTDNPAVGDVSASYTPSSTEDTTAKITGVSIMVGGTTYTEGTVTLTPDSGDVTIIVSGTNLQNRTNDNMVSFIRGVAQPMGSGYTWSVNDTGTEARRTVPLSDFVNQTTAYEIEYSNDNQQTWTGSGVYVIYDAGISEEDKAVITGVSITVDGKTYDSVTGGNVTVYSDSEVTITMTGTNFANATDGNYVFYAWGTTTSINDHSVTVNTAATPNTASFNLSGTVFSSLTNAFEIMYKNDHSEPLNGTGIYLTYDAGISEEDKAVITGMSITIDDVEYTNQNTSETNPAVITPNSTVMITVYGTNLNNGTTDQMVFDGWGSTTLTSNYSWTFNDTNTEAYMVCFAARYSILTNATQMMYTNDGWQNEIGSGVWIIYQEPTYNVTIDENIANGTVTADPTSAKAGATVTLTVTPATGYQIKTVTVMDADGKPVDFTETGVASGVYTFTMPASAVTVTATFEAIPITSAEITWGSMSFTYDDTIDETTNAEKGWSDSDTGWVTVKNTGNTTFTAQAAYASTTEEYGTIEGTFATASSELTAGSSYTFTLELNGKPTKAIPAGTKIGQVTITINGSAEG